MELLLSKRVDSDYGDYGEPILYPTFQKKPVISEDAAQQVPTMLLNADF